MPGEQPGEGQARRDGELFAQAAEKADLPVQVVALHQCSGPDLRQSSVASSDEISERDHDAGS